jgi:hypothetical protein
LGRENDRPAQFIGFVHFNESTALSATSAAPGKKNPPVQSKHLPSALADLRHELAVASRLLPPVPKTPTGVSHRLGSPENLVEELRTGGKRQ